MKKISVLFDPSSNGITKGTSRAYGIVLDEAPSSDVTVSFSAINSYVTFSASLTFTTSNYNTPQAVTISATADGIVEGKKIETVVFTASGGGYSTTKSITLDICDAGLDRQFVSGFNWKRFITIDEVSDIATKRASMISYIFNGAGLPTDDTPDTDVSNAGGLIFGSAQAVFTGWDSITKQTWIKADVDGYNWTQTTWHFINNAATKCVFVCRGHGSELYFAEIINQLLADGFSVFYSGMPVTLTDNVEANPTITGTGTAAHNDMKTGGLDRVGYSPMELFFYDKIMALNYLDANYSYTDYYITGCSGGGWTSAMLMAMTERFSRGVHVRGIKPPYFYSGFEFTATDESLTLNRDYEQYAGHTTSGTRVESFYFNTATFFDIMIMAGSNNRSNYYTHHAADDCCHNKFTFNLWKDYIKSLAASFNSGFDLTLETNASYIIHGWNTNDRAIVSSVFA
jgi:hypothetical protein